MRDLFTFKMKVVPNFPGGVARDHTGRCLLTPPCGDTLNWDPTRFAPLTLLTRMRDPISTWTPKLVIFTSYTIFATS